MRSIDTAVTVQMLRRQVESRGATLRRVTRQ